MSENSELWKILDFKKWWFGEESCRRPFTAFLSTQIWNSLFFPPSFLCPSIMYCNLLDFSSHCKFVYVSNTWIHWSYYWRGKTCLNYKHRPPCQYCTEKGIEEMRQHQSIEKLTKLMENPWSKPLIITQLVKRNKVWIYRIIVKVASFLIIFENLPNFWAHYEGDEIGN